MLPMCWSCGAWKVTYTSSALRLKIIPAIFTLVPMKCTGCFRRFYAIRGVNPATRRPAWQMENRSLRYVNKGTNIPHAIHSLFGAQGGDAVAINALVSAEQSYSPVPSTIAPATALQGNEHTEQLTNLLDALVSQNGTTTTPQVTKEPKAVETIPS